MGEVVVLEYASLDGVMQAPGNAEEDRSGGFHHGGWSQPYFADHRLAMTQALRGCGGLLFGRRTYDIFAKFWPTVTDTDDAIAVALNSLPKYVASRSLTDPIWGPASVISADLPAAVRDATRVTDGDLVVLGSGQLAHQLQAHDLVDRWEMMLHPVIVGSGAGMFGPQARPHHLRLAGCRTTDQGLVLLTYARLQDGSGPEPEPAGER